MTVGEWLKVLICAFLFTLGGVLLADVRKERLAEGIAKADFINTYYGLGLTPEQARHLNVTIVTTDIQFSPAQITVFE